MGKKVLAGAIIVIVGAVVIIAAWNVAAQESSSYPSIKLATTDCSFSPADVTAQYSATVIAKKDSDSVRDAVRTLVTKYKGEPTSWGTNTNEYQTGPGQNDYASVTSTNISANIPFADGDAFIADFQNLVTGSDTIENPNYYKTTSQQIAQSCLDDLNGIRQSEALAKFYTDELPYASENYTPAQPDNSNNNYYGSSGSNLDTIYQNIQNAYASANSYNDSLGQLKQEAGKLTVTITINATGTPATYYPPSSYYNDNTPSASQDSAQYQ